MPLKLYQEKKDSTPSFIAIAAGKGGVGKSLISVHTALALSRQGYNVGILDADIYGPSIRKMLKEDRLPSKKEGKIIPGRASGIQIISMDHFKQESEAAALRAPMVAAILKQFLTQVAWDELDFLLVDFPPGTGDLQLNLCQQVYFTGALIVTTPQEVALMDVRKAISFFSRMSIPILGVVENMSYFKNPTTQEKYFLFGKEGGKRLAQEGGVPFLGEIPVEPLLSFLADEGRSGEEEKLPVEIKKIFFQIAERVVGEALTPSVHFKNVKIKNETTLEIEWNDGQKEEFLFQEIQNNCECIQCLLGKVVHPNVGINRIEKVGRYGLRFEFSSGCSYGIYNFDFFRKLRKT